MPDLRRVPPGEPFRVADHPTRGAVPPGAGLAELHDRLEDLSARFCAQATHALLVVLQGFDGAGKDEVIRHVLDAVDPADLHVFSFNTPVGAEKDHDFLWRFHHQAPERGRVHVFDRSHYEEVISARVHGIVGDDEAATRCRSIVDFERILTRDRTVVVKVLLHLGRDEQAERVRERLHDPAKRHEFSAADVLDREKWDLYDRAYEDAITATSTEEAPWHVVPADDREAARTAVARLLVATLEALDPRWPDVDPEELEEAGIDPDDL